MATKRTYAEAAYRLEFMLRDVRTTNASAAQRMKDDAATRFLLESLPDLLTEIGDGDGTDPKDFQGALMQIATALARVAGHEESALVQRLEELHTCVAVVKLCEALPLTEEQMLATGLTVLSNVAYLQRQDLVLDAGGAELIRRLLDDAGGAGLTVRTYAAAALQNLTSNADAALLSRVVPKRQRKEVLDDLQALLDAGGEQGAAAATGALRNLRRQHSKLPKKRDEKKYQEAARQARAKQEEQRQRKEATIRIQHQWRARQLAKTGGQRLEALQNAAAIMQRFERGRAARFRQIGGGHFKALVRRRRAEAAVDEAESAEAARLLEQLGVSDGPTAADGVVEEEEPVYVKKPKKGCCHKITSPPSKDGVLPGANAYTTIRWVTH